MKNDKTYEMLRLKMNEIAVVPPQTLGPLTSLYKSIIPQFKFYPWRMAFLLSTLASFILYLLIGTSFVRIASILQFGF